MTDHVSAILPAPELQARRTTADHVADALRDAISTGRLEDGAVLNQVHIAEQLGVSRVPVREAMRMLEAEGLIDASAHRSPTVRALSATRVAELFEMRALLEGHLVATATPHIDAATLERLTAINGEMRSSPDPTGWLELNREFHTLLCRPARRPETLEVLDQVRLRAERYVQSTRGELSAARVKGVLREHAAIIKAVKSRDPEAARAVAIKHVENTRKYLESRRSPVPGS